MATAETDPIVAPEATVQDVTPPPASTAAERSLTIHPKVTGTFIAGILARWILGIIEYRTSIDFSKQTLWELTIFIAFVGGYFAPARAALPEPKGNAGA